MIFICLADSLLNLFEYYLAVRGIPVINESYKE